MSDKDSGGGRGRGEGRDGTGWVTDVSNMGGEHWGEYKRGGG